MGPGLRSRAALGCATILLASSYCEKRLAADGPRSFANDRLLSMVQRLSDPDPHVRETAACALRSEGEHAFDVLFALRTSEDTELRMVTNRLLRQIRNDVIGQQESMSSSVRQYLFDYERQSISRRRVLMSRLETMDSADAVFALANLVRFELVPSLSKQAALCIIRNCTVNQDHWAIALHRLASCSRTGANWIREASQYRHPREFARAWRGHLIPVFNTTGHETRDVQRELLPQLVRWVLERSKRLGEPECFEEVATFCADRCPPSLITPFTDCFIQLNAYAAMNRLVERYRDDFANRPELLLRHAQSQNDQANLHACLGSIQRAVTLFRHPQTQFEAALRVFELGYLDVAHALMDLTCSRDDATDVVRVRVNLIVAEWYHQQNRNDRASERLQQIVDWLEQTSTPPTSSLDNLGVSHSQIVSRMCYFRALAAFEANEPDVCGSNILRGIIADPNHTDLLILGCRTDVLGQDERAMVEELVEMARTELQLKITSLQSIEPRPDDSIRKQSALNKQLAELCNRYAWLTANTARQPELALHYARQANDLEDRNPFYLDTEARCWFLAGNTARAILVQHAACQLAPNDFSLADRLRNYQRFQARIPIANKPRQTR